PSPRPLRPDSRQHGVPFRRAFEAVCEHHVRLEVDAAVEAVDGGFGAALADPALAPPRRDGEDLAGPGTNPGRHELDLLGHERDLELLGIERYEKEAVAAGRPSVGSRQA